VGSGKAGQRGSGGAVWERWVSSLGMLGERERGLIGYVRAVWECWVRKNEKRNGKIERG
jgi:hypothetical protein